MFTETWLNNSVPDCAIQLEQLTCYRADRALVEGGKFPKIHQHVDFPTRGKNTLDFVYTTQRGAYKALPLPHLGASDHITVMLMPAYRPLVKVIKPIHKQIQVWPEGSSEALQDCFDTTDWNMFKQAATYNNTTDLQEYTETVTAYITKCIDDVTVTKTITVRANQKPWLTGEVYRLLKARNAAFRAGDEEGLKTARANLSRGQRGQETVLQEDSPSFQRQQRHSEPVAGNTDHYGL